MTAVGVAALMWQPSSAQRYALESCFTCFEALGSGRRDGLQLQAEHLADLRGSGLTDETIVQHRIFTVPPSLIGPLLGYEATEVLSAYLLGAPRIRRSVLSPQDLRSFKGSNGTVKYLQPWPVSTSGSSGGSQLELR